MHLLELLLRLRQICAHYELASQFKDKFKEVENLWLAEMEQGNHFTPKVGV